MHPPAGHLPHHGIHPDEFFDFGFDVVTFVYHGFFNLVAVGG
jgi:hypothetical protein